MIVATAALMEAGAGDGLPPAVREALIDIGSMCNEIVLTLDDAYVALLRARADRSAVHSGILTSAWRVQSTNDMFRCADAQCDRLAVVLARSASMYALYASQVAQDVVAGRVPDGPVSTAVAPSVLVSNADRLLPEISFSGTSDVLEDQNTNVATARSALFATIDEDLRGGSVSCYDDPASVDETQNERDRDMAALPGALLGYASTLAWAVGIYTTTDPVSTMSLDQP